MASTPARGYHEVTIPSTDTRIVLSVYPAAPGAPVVVFVPGTMTHPLFYDEFLTRLSAEGINVVGVHPLSHGKSPRERDVYRFVDLVDNVRDATHWAAVRFRCPAVLLGSSQGGSVALAASVGAAEVAGVLAHNVFVPELEASAAVGRFPRLFRRLHRLIHHGVPYLARLWPTLEVPVGAYLDLDRVTRDPEIRRRFETDPLGLRSYPLGYLGSLLGTRLDFLHDGRLGVPVAVLATTGDELFSLDYSRRVFERIVAPRKELVVLDVPVHLLFNEAIDAALGAVVPRVRAMIAEALTTGPTRLRRPARP